MDSKALLTLVALLLPALCSLRAEETSRPVTGVYSLGIGHSDVVATYLSPLHYTGTTLSASGDWQKAMPFAPEKAVMNFTASAEWSDLLNPAQTARMIGLMGRFAWGISWRHRLPWSLQVTAGPQAGFYAGAYYLMRNGNNPVQAMANVNLALRASLSRPFRIKNLPLLVSETVTLPSASVFFSPQYGETYYEIYLGNHSGLVHAGWWGNNFGVDNLLSVGLDFGRTAMTLGYRYSLTTQWACHLNTKATTHSLVIGIVPGGLGLKRKKPAIPARTVSPLFLND